MHFSFSGRAGGDSVGLKNLVQDQVMSQLNGEWRNHPERIKATDSRVFKHTEIKIPAELLNKSKAAAKQKKRGKLYGKRIH